MLCMAREDGLPIKKNAFDSAWQRIIDKATTDGIMVDGEKQVLTATFTFHDLKAKGITDHKSNASGHRTEKAKKVYIRRLSTSGD